MKALALASFLSVGWVYGIAEQTPDEDAIAALRSASNKAIAAGDITGFSANLDRDFVVVTGKVAL